MKDAYILETLSAIVENLLLDRWRCDDHLFAFPNAAGTPRQRFSTRQMTQIENVALAHPA